MATQNLSYVVFSGNQYYNCSISPHNARDVCDSDKRDISQLFKCLSPVPTMPPIASSPKTPTKADNGNTDLSKQGFKQTFIIIVIAILVVAVIVLFVIIFVYCKCLKALIALESEANIFVDIF